MKRFKFSAMLAVAATAMVLTAAVASAAEERTFQASVEMTLRGWDADGNWVYSGTATVPHWGRTAHWSVVDLPNNDKKPAVGTTTVQFGNGDSFTIEFEQFWDPDEGSWVGEYWVTGGTGKFAGATGSGMIASKPVAAGTVVVSYAGTIRY